jgi:hypothetical protein
MAVEYNEWNKLFVRELNTISSSYFPTRETEGNLGEQPDVRHDLSWPTYRTLACRCYHKPFVRLK